MPAEPWDVVVFQRHKDDDPNEICPADRFFGEIPDSVATDLFAIIDAVAASPPPQFTGGGVWEAMHGATSLCRADLESPPVSPSPWTLRYVRSIGRPEVIDDVFGVRLVGWCNRAPVYPGPAS